MTELQEIDKLEQLYREHPTLFHRPGRIRSSGRDIGRVLELDGETIIVLQTLTGMAEHRNDIAKAKRCVQLRDALVQEQELVERLRRSKLELERRAVAAEAELDETSPANRKSLWTRLLGRDGET